MRTMRRSEKSAIDRASRRNAPRSAGAAIAPDDLAGDDPIERQVLELVDLAHAAGAEAFDGLEPVERRQRRGGGSAPSPDSDRVSDKY